MARVYDASRRILIFSFPFIVLLCSTIDFASANKELNENNWKEILEGEWMLEFYAPWCPACNALAPAWKELSTRAAKNSLPLRTAAVDVTNSPGLSGRFVVTALPTIFHVKDGEFRQYKGPRDVESMLTFVENKKWKQTDPIPGWKAPDSLQMSLVAEFFKMSQALRGVHNMLMEAYGLPSWGSYLIFAIATIFVGALVGLILVCVIDFLHPPQKVDKKFISRSELEKLARGDNDGKKSDDEQELINDDILDDAENSPNSDAEKNSPSDTSEDENEKTSEAAGDSKPADKDSSDKPEARKRRPRKAD
ncbi:thioredoxin-related transmembrane protein 1-like [Bombyx mandarina]|uniref:Thioredoxin-related transmembrane protein 1-like n=1 Tax=Bombyx mandarina TaxID=7092 RepID=A0A6J2KB20_BOMMA|nr:thioredoxin-related transmembrane protein 1-like [Bombyx mandarina]